MMRVKPRNYVAKAIQSGAGKHKSKRQQYEEDLAKREVFKAEKTTGKNQLDESITTKVDVHE
jgi:hypothetical protein